MSYVSPDYKNGKLFKTAVGLGVKHETYSPGPFGTPQNGTDCIEGPHYPKPHSWYVSVTVVDGIVTKAGNVKLGQYLKCSKCQSTIDRARAKSTMGPKCKPICVSCESGSVTAPSADTKPYDHVSAIIAYEQGNLSDDDTVTLFQYLVDTGLAWSLQGHYGRTAHAMIAAGLVIRR